MKKSSFFTIAAIGVLLCSSHANADQVILDDLIVDGSNCVGQDCVNGESFGFDTIRLKENNLRIKFQDTSTSASFPSNDWQITINESSNGGANKFSIDDIDGGRTPFTIEASAPSHSLYVDDGGRIGFGTSTPVVELHVKDGDTPTLRLEQDGSSGFTPQTWDVAGNETNFFIRDATNGSKLPFRIRPEAPSNSIFVDTDGDIGIGTSSPESNLHVLDSGSSKVTVQSDGTATSDLAAVYLKSNTGKPAFFLFRDEGGPNEVKAKYIVSDNKSNFGTITDHPVVILTENSAHTTFETNGHLTMAVGGGTYDGSWNDGSSRTLKENIEDLDTDSAITALHDLTPVKYAYKTNKAEERLGFIAEDVPELVAMNNRKSLNSMDIVAVLTKVVQEQQKLLADQNQAIQGLNDKLENLAKQDKSKTSL